MIERKKKPIIECATCGHGSNVHAADDERACCVLARYDRKACQCSAFIPVSVVAGPVTDTNQETTEQLPSTP